MSNGADDIERIVAPFLTFKEMIGRTLAILLVMFALYGIYVVVFGLSIHILSRHDGPSSRLYMGWSISLFVLAMFYIAIFSWGLFRQTVIQFKAAMTKNYTPFLKYATFDKGEISWVSIDSFVNCIMNVIADSMLIHRCCVIWQSRIMTYLLAFLAVVLNGINFGCIIAGVVGLSISNHHLYGKSSTIDNGITIAIAIFQVLLALLTGGRIWWISQQARHLMGYSTNARYNSIIAIIIESGVLYAACLVADFTIELTVDPNNQGLIPFDFAPVVTLMSGLAPTLIIVRVAFGKSVDSVQQMVSSQLAESAQGNSQEPRPAVDLQLKTQISGHVHSKQLNEPLPLPVTDGLGNSVMSG